MTECERILIKRPEITADFLKEETRCEFFCDVRRKKIWLVLLDLAMEFDRASSPGTTILTPACRERTTKSSLA